MSGQFFDNLKVLVIDDNKHARKLAETILTQLGCRTVFTAADTTEAWDMFVSLKPHVLMLDLYMEPQNGLEFALKVRRDPASKNPAAPIIMMTGEPSRAAVEAARNAGIDELLAKPFSAACVMERFESIVKHPRAFIKAPGYIGPDRRRRSAEDGFEFSRRRSDKEGAA